MGNQASCTPYITSGGGGVKVVHGDDGRVEKYTRPVKAAEILLENPRQFVCDSGDLKVGHRIPGLTAAEELKRHRAYFLLPMDMLYSVLTEEELAALSGKASGGGGVKREARRRPTTEPAPSDVESTDEMWRQRSWKPALDTIQEASCMM